ncbi:hypothetical protein PILCRDRAFT_528969 [Piloderma croceum F 1598]|uniref:Uncharacterized protein n=1 Tax=Piloderma croceum (strain F 1598) TaxID=765440 RepID=A0A0C3F7Q5_PILCF|nr:hypothetical protein PILCRDRAFT_528969 [Piloderma croceum F 1598]
MGGHYYPPSNLFRPGSSMIYRWGCRECLMILAASEMNGGLEERLNVLLVAGAKIWVTGGMTTPVRWCPVPIESSKSGLSGSETLRLRLRVTLLLQGTTIQFEYRAIFPACRTRA